MLDSTVSSSHYVYLSFTMHSQQDVLLTHLNKFPFLLAKGVIWASFRQLAGVIFTHTYLLRLISMKKNYSAIARRKNIPFYPARTGISFPHFQLARRYFRFPSKLITQCNFSSQLKFGMNSRYFVKRLRWVLLTNLHLKLETSPGDNWHSHDGCKGAASMVNRSVIFALAPVWPVSLSVNCQIQI